MEFDIYYTQYFGTFSYVSWTKAFCRESEMQQSTLTIKIFVVRARSKRQIFVKTRRFIAPIEDYELVSFKHILSIFVKSSLNTESRK